MKTPEISLIYASIPKSRPKIQNHCTETPEISLIYASIPKSGPEIQNHCTETPEISRIYASILDSGPEIQNRCTETQQISRICAPIPKSGPEIKNHCTETPEMSRILAVQHSRAVQAETGCHEGGIILSKKPPEGRLSPPLQRCLCPILIFVAATKNGPPATVTRLHVPAATAISGKGRRVRRRCGR